MTKDHVYSYAATDKTPRVDEVAALYPGGWMNMNEAAAHYNALLELARQLEQEGDAETRLATKTMVERDALERRLASISAGPESVEVTNQREPLPLRAPSDGGILGGGDKDLGPSAGGSHQQPVAWRYVKKDSEAVIFTDQPPDRLLFSDDYWITPLYVGSRAATERQP